MLRDEGVLPSPAGISIYLGDQTGVTEGSKIYFYHYNPLTGLIETLPNSSDYIVDKNGYITVDIVHCSDYVVLMKKAKASLITSLKDQITVKSTKKTLYTGETNQKGSIKITLPAILKLVKSLSELLSKGAIGGVAVTYRSGNSSLSDLINYIYLLVVLLQ